MLVSVQFEALVWTPLNVTKLWIVPTVGPKFVPAEVERVYASRSSVDPWP